MRVRLRCWKSTSKDNEYTAALGPKGRFACKEPTPLCLEAIKLLINGLKTALIKNYHWMKYFTTHRYYM